MIDEEATLINCGRKTHKIKNDITSITSETKMTPQKVNRGESSMYQEMERAHELHGAELRAYLE